MVIKRRKRNPIRSLRAIRARHLARRLFRKLDRQEMKKHVSLTGKTWCGKSVAMEQIIYAHRAMTQKKQDEAIVVLDPHGDTYTTVKRFDLALENPERLICIDPTLREGHTVTINPLELRSRSLRDIEISTQSLVNVFEELIPDSRLSNYMRALLNPCIATLLRLRTCSITDLKDFMRTEPPEELLTAWKLSPFAAHRRFFQEEFMNHGIYRQTKGSIYTKLQSLLNNSGFYNQVVWTSTINLEYCLRSWKVILVNLWSLGPEAGEAFGRFLISQIKSIAMRSMKLAPQQRPHIRIYIDEVDAVITTSLNAILKETRKFWLSAFICGQSFPSGRGSEAMRQNLLTNTSVKMIGTSSLPNLSILAKETGIPLLELKKLRNFQFRIKSWSSTPTRVRTRDLFGKWSALLIDPYESMALNTYLIEQSWTYKPVLPLPPSPGEEWLNTLEGDLKTSVERTIHPQPKFWSYNHTNEPNWD